MEYEMNTFGMKFTIEIIQPDTTLACDKVGCNLTMENDGCVGKGRYITSLIIKHTIVLQSKIVILPASELPDFMVKLSSMLSLLKAKKRFSHRSWN